jgi:hypothetical protein
MSIREKRDLTEGVFGGRISPCAWETRARVAERSDPAEIELRSEFDKISEPW